MPIRNSKYQYSKAADGYVRRQTRQGVDYNKFATKEWALLISFFRWYPDILEDITESENPEFHNSLINRVMKRYMVRYATSFTAAARGLGKTTNLVSVKSDNGILWPGDVTGYYAPVEKQAAPLASKAFATYSRNYPILADHYVKNSDARDHFKVSTINGSKFIMSIDRGIDTSGVVAEECAQEDKNPFDFDEFNQVVLGTNRLTHKINGEDDPTHIDSQIHYITSATRKENTAYTVYMGVRKAMCRGESAYAISIPWQVPVLCHMKSVSYYAMLKKNLTAEQFMRECETKWVGSVESPIIRDDILRASRKVKVMEERHCGDPEVFYILGYDVSSRDHAGNALTALATIKCERQHRTDNKDRYRKSLVYVEDRRPPLSAREHAILIKKRWADYTLKEGRPAFVVVDAWAYGQSVIEQLHDDLGDGFPPMCTMNNDDSFAALVQPGAIPCIYPMQATGSGGSDPNNLMLDYIEREFERGNVRLLIPELAAGLQAYKLKHNIKDDYQDARIQAPYNATNRLCRQISNLQKKYSTKGWTEQEISKYIPKDMWSALLYACRLAQRIEHDELYALNRRNNEWEEYAKKYDYYNQMGGIAPRRRTTKRQGRSALKDDHRR